MRSDNFDISAGTAGLNIYQPMRFAVDNQSECFDWNRENEKYFHFDSDLNQPLSSLRIHSERTIEIILPQDAVVSFAPIVCQNIFRSRVTHTRQTPCHYGFFDRWIVRTFPLSETKQPITTNKQRLSQFVSFSPPRRFSQRTAMWFACVHRLTNLYTKKSLLTNVENIARDHVWCGCVCASACDCFTENDMLLNV